MTFPEKLRALGTWARLPAYFREEHANFNINGDKVDG